MRYLFAALCGLLLAPSAFAQSLTPSAFKALGAPNNPAVEVAWNRFYDYEGMTDILQKLAAAHPELSTLESLGQSYGGRELWLLTIANPETGDPDRKSAMWIDGNIHGNEIQTTEVSLYTAWYLLELYDTNPWIKDLVDTKTIYILPSMNPDGRESFINEPERSRWSRGGQVPVDDDGDGLVEEDCGNDLDGNGQLTQMRVKVPGGRWKPHPDELRQMVRCALDEACEYDLIFTEGIDDDGDGRVDEDCVSSYDPNRNWGWFWRPNYIQRGAHHFPFSVPETKAISDFIKARPNILAGQSYHNTGGMMLRGPGAAEDRTYRADDAVFDLIGEKGEQMLPGYDYFVIHKDLYTVYGGETDWMYASEGIMPFANEMFTSFNLFRSRERNAGDSYRFDRLVLFGEFFVDWTPFDHPTYGPVEIGGTKRNFGRLPPSFLLEEELHRNMAFTLYHAYELPVVTFEEVLTEDLGGGLFEVTATLVNHRAIPTRLAVDVQNNINRPDWVTLEGATVVSSGVKSSKFADTYTEQPSRPERVEIQAVPGQGRAVVMWIVRGDGPYTLTYDSLKGGQATHEVR
ncbi:MAG: M14 family metallopeptidase [Bacteroidota bacterium]